MLEFRMLGPLEVVQDGRSLPLGAPRQRTLLAILLLHRREVVSSERLIDELWGEHPPATAPKTLQGYISHLRKVLGADVLVTRNGGYMLAAAPEAVDLERLEALAAQARERLADGDAAAARELLDSALALWRGEPLADLAYESFAQPEIARAEDERLAALEDRIDVDLALGRHRALVGELEALVKKHPNRERLLAQLMLVLYRSGRQADALDAYRTGRQALRDDLGLDPGPELRALEQQILDHDPEIEAPRSRLPRARPTSRLPAARVLIGAGGVILLVAAIAAAVSALRSGEPELLAGPNSVAAIDVSSGRVHSAIAVGASPGGVAAGEGAVWVANTGDGTVSRVDPDAGVVRQTIRVGKGPVAVAAGGGAVWVANGVDGTVSRIDPATNEVVQRIHVGNGPTGVAVGEGAVWVANSVDGTVSRIDPATGRMTKTLPAVAGASGVAVGFARLWVVSPSAGELVSLDPRSGQVLEHIVVGTDPAAVAAGGGAVWVANRGSDTVWRIDARSPARVSSVIQVGRAPSALVATSDSIWVANATDNSVTRIDAAHRRAAKTVHLASPPQGLAAWRDGLYVAVRSSNQAHRGGTLRVAQSAPDFIDPALAYVPESFAILSMTNDGLVGFRRVGGIEGVQLVPNLAVSLPRPTDGGRAYTFRLRPGLRYSTGDLVRPADFRRAIERSFEIRPDQPGRQYFGDILGAADCRHGRCDLSRGVVTDDAARTVTFRLSAPDAGFLTKLALPSAFAVPSTTSAVNTGSRPLPATGPYKIATYRKNAGMTLVRNTRFREWSADARPDGYPDTIRMTFDGTPAAPKAEPRAVLSGDTDVAGGGVQLEARALRTFALRHPSQVHLSPLPATTFFLLNTHAAPFDDIRVRRAVEYVFDQRALARRNGPGFAPTCQIMPPDFPGYRRTCPYTSGGAEAIRSARRVAQSGAGSQVTVWVPGPRRADGRYMVEVLQTLGFRTRLKVIRDLGAYFTQVNPPRGHAQVAWYAWAADYPSQAGFMLPLFECASAVFTPNRYCDRRVDRSLAAASDADARNPTAAPALWQRAERMILAKAPIVPMYNLQEATFVAKRVGNVQHHPQWGALLDRMWVR
jgi:YVTN family beta-propeller protein